MSALYQGKASSWSSVMHSPSKWSTPNSFLPTYVSQNVFEERKEQSTEYERNVGSNDAVPKVTCTLPNWEHRLCIKWTWWREGEDTNYVHMITHACTHTKVYFPTGLRSQWGHRNGVTPAPAGRGDKRCCFKLWRPSFLGATVYPPLKYNGGLWRLERSGQRLPSVCCFERRRN